MTSSVFGGELLIAYICLLLSVPRISAVDFAEISIDQRLSQAAQIATNLQIDGHDNDWPGFLHVLTPVEMQAEILHAI
jgi:hypothetical protein